MPDTCTTTTRSVADELVRITPRDLWLLELLREHRTLTTEHLTTLGFLSGHRARKRLLLLHRRDVLDRWRYHVRPGSQSWRWTLGPLGAAILASRDGRPVPRPASVRAATDRLAGSGAIHHLLGCNGFFVALAFYARAHRGGTSWVGGGRRSGRPPRCIAWRGPMGTVCGYPVIRGCRGGWSSIRARRDCDR